MHSLGAARERRSTRLAEVVWRERHDGACEAVARRRGPRLRAAVVSGEERHPLRSDCHVAQQQRQHAGADGAEADDQQARGQRGVESRGRSLRATRPRR
jgi:hypothetical protein